MTKTLIATIVIWTAGIGSAAALVTTLQRRPPAPPAQSELAREPSREEPPPNFDHFKVPKPLTMLSATNIRAQLQVPHKPTKPTRSREMRCSGFHPMQTGPVNQGVRYCQ